MNFEKKKIWVAIDDIELIDDTQARVEYDQVAIKEYRQAFEDDTDIKDKPVKLVQIDGHEKYSIIDGHHRYIAAKEAGMTNLYAVIGDETVDNVTEALALAALENLDHGVRLTSADKRKAIRCLLQSKQYKDINNVAIAKMLHVSYGLVDSVRRELEDSGEIERKETPTEKAEKAIAESPDKQNVQIARELGISEGTVRNARKNLEKKNCEPTETLESEEHVEQEQSEHDVQIDEQLEKVSAKAKEYTANYEYINYPMFLDYCRQVQDWLDNPASDNDELTIEETDNAGNVAAKVVCNSDDIDGVISPHLANVIDLLLQWARCHGYDR